jgi:hypothetical protein
MKYLLPLLASVLFIGCAGHDERVMVETPSVAAAGKSVRNAKAIAKNIANNGTLAKSTESAQLVKSLQEAEAQLAEAQNKIEIQAKDYEKALNRLNYIEPKYSEAVGILWKWRLITIGLLLSFAAFFILRQYFPFLKIL